MHQEVIMKGIDLGSKCQSVLRMERRVSKYEYLKKDDLEFSENGRNTKGESNRNTKGSKPFFP